MISIKGKFYDGRTSAEVTAVCFIYDNGAVRVENSVNGRRILSLSRFTIKISPRLADTLRYLHFPNGEKFETQDNLSADRIAKRFAGTRWTGWLHQLESRWRFALIALAAMLLFVWGGIKYGLPLAASVIAFRLPPAILHAAGEQTLGILDKSVLSKSDLDEAVRSRLQAHFRPVIEAHPDQRLTVLFRKGGRVGPNAFALPDGTIIFTDEMVRIANHDDELVAILTHEIGHVVHRHSLRAVIQDSLLGFALLAITGDTAGSSELFLGLPVLLTQMAYSRTFEREADNYALDYMRANDIPPIHFAHLMRRIEQTASPLSTESEPNWSGYLSSHPLTAERIQPFEKGTNGP
jgi:Zn-dependent protease with chaperone function